MPDLRLYKPCPPSNPSPVLSRSPVDPERCAVVVRRGDHRFSHWGQCNAKGKYDAVIEGQSVKVCGSHRPDFVAERNAKRKAESDAKYAAYKNAQARKFERPAEYRAALQAIAAGHNDARTLAREVLDKWGDA